MGGSVWATSVGVDATVSVAAGALALVGAGSAGMGVSAGAALVGVGKGGAAVGGELVGVALLISWAAQAANTIAAGIARKARNISRRVSLGDPVFSLMVPCSAINCLPDKNQKFHSIGWNFFKLLL